MAINDTYDVAAAFRAIEKELIASMIRNLDRHRAEETAEGYNWSMWQAEQLRALDQYKRQNQMKYGTQFRGINRQIDELLRMANADGNMAQEVEILDAIRRGFPAQHVGPGAAAEFFRLNDRKLDALIQATVNDMERAETAVLRMVNDQYRKIIYNAQVYANTGAGTYEKSVDMATHDFLAAGINCIQYANGSRHTIADYADMAIRTASKRAYLQGEGVKRQEWGISTVIMNKRGNPCPKCLPFVGKILIDDVWSGGSTTGKSPVTGRKYPLMSTAIAAGLYHPRCKDSHTTYFEGISSPPDGNYSAREIRNIEKINARGAKQQYAERQEKRWARLADYSLDPGNKKQYAARRNGWELKTRTDVSPKLAARAEHVDGIPDHEEPRYLGKIIPTEETIQQLLQTYEQQAIDLVIETACVITEDGEVWQCFGTEDQVFPNIDLDGKLENSIVSHNHPEDLTSYSFSADDFELFMDYHLKILRGFDTMYTYELSRADLTVDESSGVGLFDMTPEEYRHEEMIDTAKKAGVGYKRWKTKPDK